ncbi:DUF5709 domain-containing protein [Streptomyces sp. TP-A0874]|uniref:DUF5709 domain-containing protein n=1 Tax=Streptomyces sp. TP-A0874 TaxID=549819 RepID=UPI000853246B|nr:DUF5709 domain-containing protein [Streptomyces sp. TP-A0874]
MNSPHDPGRNPEDEGIPDLQDGTPEQQEASDPQRQSVPGDEPTAVEDHGTTLSEALRGESLDDRLAEEEPEVDPVELAEADGEGAAPWEDPERDGPPPPGPEREQAGLLYDEPDPDLPREQDVFSQEGSVGGLSSEEEAVRVVDDDDEQL